MSAHTIPTKANTNSAMQGNAAPTAWPWTRRCLNCRWHWFALKTDIVGRFTWLHFFLGQKHDIASVELVEFKADFDANLHSDRLSVLRRRFESPTLYCLNCPLIEPHPKSALNADVAWFSVRAHDHRKDASPFVFCLTR